jgi:hypothetical protein
VNFTANLGAKRSEHLVSTLELIEVPHPARKMGPLTVANEPQLSVDKGADAEVGTMEEAGTLKNARVNTIGELELAGGAMKGLNCVYVSHAPA